MVEASRARLWGLLVKACQCVRLSRAQPRVLKRRDRQVELFGRARLVELLGRARQVECCKSSSM